MDKAAEREQREKSRHYDEIKGGLIETLRASGELAKVGSVTAAERQQLRQLNRQLKFYIQKVGNMKGAEPIGRSDAAQAE